KNGHTFIACRSPNQLMEVDKDGKEVVTIRRNEHLYTAARLRDGNFAILIHNGVEYRCVRLDRTGKELKSYKVPFDPIGGGLYFNILSNGHVLLGQYGTGKVTEVDREGKQIWEAKIQWPYMVTRAPNGNTLVASMQARKVTELDRGGKVVREFKDQN